MDERYFFLMVPETKHGITTAEMVHCTGEERPYITNKINGLWSTRTHSDMFEYIPGDNIARLVPDVRRPGRIRYNVRLREDQIALLNRAIETKYFFNN